MAHGDPDGAARRPRAGRWLAAAVAAGALVGLTAAAWVSVRQELGAQARRLGELERRVARLEAQGARSPEQPTQPQSGAVAARVYFTRATPSGQLELVGVTRQLPASAGTPARLALLLEALLQGPRPDQGDPPGLLTQIPPGTRLLGVRVQGQTALLDFSRELEQTAGTMRLAGMLRQIVFTATEAPGVRQVVLLVEGERAGTEAHPFTGDGLLFGELSRERLPL